MQSVSTWQEDGSTSTQSHRRSAARDIALAEERDVRRLMLVASVVIVPLVLLAVWLGASSDAINLGVTAVVGGPHVFATFTATFADKKFRRRHPFLIASSLLIPAGVVWLTIHDFQALMSVFIVAASLHVLHQCALPDRLLPREGRRCKSGAGRGSSTTACSFRRSTRSPLYKIVHGSFYLGDVPIMIPRLLMRMETAYLEWAIFAGFLGAWLYKTMNEHREGTLNVPKTLLIAVTMFFCVPRCPAWPGSTASSSRSSRMNAWHSFQYLGLVWLINTMRLERGQLTNKFVARLSGAKGAKWFYAWNVGITLLLLVFVKSVVAWDPLGLPKASSTTTCSRSRRSSSTTTSTRSSFLPRSRSWCRRSPRRGGFAARTWR